MNASCVCVRYAHECRWPVSDQLHSCAFEPACFVHSCCIKYAFHMHSHICIHTCMYLHSFWQTAFMCIPPILHTDAYRAHCILHRSHPFMLHFRLHVHLYAFIAAASIHPHSFSVSALQTVVTDLHSSAFICIHTAFNT